MWTTRTSASRFSIVPPTPIHNLVVLLSETGRVRETESWFQRATGSDLVTRSVPECGLLPGAGLSHII